MQDFIPTEPGLSKQDGKRRKQLKVVTGVSTGLVLVAALVALVLHFGRNGTIVTTDSPMRPSQRAAPSLPIVPTMPVASEPLAVVQAPVDHDDLLPSAVSTPHSKANAVDAPTVIPARVLPSARSPHVDMLDEMADLSSVVSDAAAGAPAPVLPDFVRVPSELEPAPNSSPESAAPSAIALEGMSEDEVLAYVLSLTADTAVSANARQAKAEAAIAVFCADNQFVRHAIVDDGNCLVRAVSLALTGSQDNHAHYRATCAAELRDNPGRYVGYYDANADETFQEWIEKQSKQREYGDLPSIAALAARHKVTIIVYEATTTKNPEETVKAVVQITGQGTRTTTTIRLLRVNGNHFELLTQILPDTVG